MDEKIIRPQELREGEECVITHWVNQPQYVGDKLRVENCQFIRTTKDGLDTTSVDMRYPSYCKLVLSRKKVKILKIKNMREEINAKWANEQATKVLGEKINNQINTCLNKIEVAVKENKMNCIVSIYAESLTMSELRKRGFVLRQENTQKDGSWLTINW